MQRQAFLLLRQLLPEVIGDKPLKQAVLSKDELNEELTGLLIFTLFG